MAVSGFDLFGGGGGGIKNVQSGYISGSAISTNTTYNHPISPVDPQKSFVLIEQTTVGFGYNRWRVNLLNATTIRFARQTASSGPDHIIFYVIELEEGVVHRGNFSRSINQTNGYQLPIPPVDLSKSFSVITSTSDATNTANPIARLVAPDKLEFNTTTPSGTYYIEWQVIEMG